MDVTNAFNNVHHIRLSNNLRKRGIPRNIIRWIESFLRDRSTRITFNGNQSKSFPTPAGVPQGSPLSPILYIFYNTDLLEISPSPTGHIALGFIDDIGYGVKGLTAEGNAERLEGLLTKAEDWRRKHGAQFERSKYILVHFTRNCKIKTEATVNIDGTTITPAKEAKYLGVIFDKELRYHKHINQAIQKGT